MFSAYWNRPDATRAAFENPEAPPPQRWFRTGDVAEQASGRWVIRGRLTADIIKSSGYKLSALEIENVILEDADVAECAVLGVPDAVAGERVAALIAPRSGLSLAEAQARFAAPALRAALASRLSPYKIPTLVRIVDSIPR
jgi:malonyl-CoA/methylmalonyl-CoA synthetase